MSDKPRITKYGMPASESQRYLANHFVVMEERRLLSDVHLAYALRVGPGLRAALDKLGGVAVAAPAVPEVPQSVATEPAHSKPDDLRTALGLK